MAEIWNGVALAWEEHASLMEQQLGPATQLLLDAAAVGEGAAVLDLATGAGGAGLAAAGRVGSSGRVVLADLAPDMVSAAARRAAGRAGVSTLVGDQEAIAAPDASFDAVIIRLGLMFAGDPVAAVREAARVLRPGRRYAAATWGRREDNPWLGVIFGAVEEQFGVPFPPPGVAGPFALDDPGALVAVLEAAGLQDVSVQTVGAPLTTASLEAWWERVPALAGPLATALRSLEPEVRDAIHERALEGAAAAQRPTGAGVVLDGSVLVASGRRP